MRLVPLSTAICLLVSVPATAQTTRCNWFGGTMNCNTTQPPGYYPPLPQFRPIDTGAIRATQLRRQVGRLVASDQCDEARNVALDAGDFALAREVDLVCQPSR